MSLSGDPNNSFDSFDEDFNALMEARRRKQKEKKEKSNHSTTTDNDDGAPPLTPEKPKTSRKSKSPRKQKNQISWRDDPTEKENASSPPKSPGLSPSKFHRRRFYDPKERKITADLKERIERNILTQEKIQHKEKLEAERKDFRKVTTLKTWPLQDLAMEHLDHLLNGKSSLSQFHGGEYLSSESSSSTGSAAQSGKRRQSTSEGACSKPVDPVDSAKNVLESNEPLWSREPRIFATEKAQGKRKYLVGHFGRIADWYWRKSVSKHLYEVIRQQTPCRLYFDLEFSKKFNQDIDEDKLLDEFREELVADFREHYNVNLEQSCIIDLDSSTDQKFSRHWIVDMDQEGFFEDAPTAGRFVKRLVSRLANEQGSNKLHDRRPTLAKHLFVKTKETNKPSCFIDLGVYTRNRLFRCFGSSKFGKPNVLKIAPSNEYALDALPAGEADKDGGSSTGNSSAQELHAQTPSLNEYIVANNWEPHARVLASTLVIPLGGSEGKRIFRVDEEESVIMAASSKRGSASRSFQPAVSIHTAQSPLPSLENFVRDVLGSRGGAQGTIRAWSIEYGGSNSDVPVSITFQMCRNRFCELIGRSHKSNNIFWTIIFETWSCIQGCHDPECFGRGAPVPVRQDYLGPIKEEFQAWRDEEFEKALMSLNLDELPRVTAKSSKEQSLGPTKVAERVDGSVVNSSREKDHPDDEFLSDEALLEAIEANPELFP